MRFELENGLTWIHAPQTTSPVVAIQVWVKTGSADEQPGEFGLAHLHEHMLFKGTAHRGPGEIARDIEAHGGEINAWTSFDQTVYHVVMASRFFANGVEVLADAMRSSTFDSEELSREIEVVVEELKRSMDMPSRKLSKALFALTYGPHPYARPVIGTEESVRSMSQAKMKAFFEKHYRPDNVCVVVTGDVSLEDAKREVEKGFGGKWGGVAPKLPARAKEVWPVGPRAEVVRDDVKEAHLSIAFPAPPLDSEDVPALDVLAVILGQGESSRLELAVRRKGLANDARSYAYTPQDSGLFALDATLEAAQVPACTTALLAEALRLRDEPCDAAELDAAKAMLEADSIYQRETVQGIARRLGFFETSAGGLDEEARYQERVASLTAADVQAAARKYLDLRLATAVALVPNSDTTLTSEALRTLLVNALPAGGPPRPGRAPEIPYARSAVRRIDASSVEPKLIRRVLPNGVTVLVRREVGVPLVALRAVLPGGLLFESDADSGLHQLLARSVTQGTAHHSAEAIAHLTDAMAGNIGGNAGRNSVGLRGEFLTRHLDRGFDLFTECLLEPAFSEEEVARERTIQLQQIKTRDDHPSGVAFRLFHRGLYGSHPYHRDLAGELDSVSSLTGASLGQAWKSRLTGGGLVVSVVGECDPDAVLALAAKKLGGLPKATGGFPADIEIAPLKAATLMRQDATKAQAHLVYGFLGTTLKDPDRYALEVLSSVLSGQGGRLFIELRDKRSMAYSVSSFSMEGPARGYFAVYIGTSPEKVPAAMAGVRAELEKIRETAISEAELDRSRSYLIGSHAIALQKNSSRAATVALDELYGLGAENHREYEQRILAVDAAAVRAVAQRIIRFDSACAALLGPADAVVAL